MKKREEDINLLLIEVQELIDALYVEFQSAIKRPYQKSLSDAKIKSAMEHLRSALDYSAHDVFETLAAMHKSEGTPIKDRDIAFPIHDDKLSFEKKIDNRFPNLQKHLPRIYNIFESVQKYKPSKDWMIRLHKHVNQVKHQGLLNTQQRNNTSKLFLGPIPGTTDIPFIEIFGGDVTIHSSEFTYTDKDGNTVTTKTINDKIEVKDGVIPNTQEIQDKKYKIEYETSFAFNGSNEDVIKFLKKALKEVKWLTASIYAVLT